MQSLAGRLEQDSRSLERQVGQLRRELREVDEELGNIAAELGFARSQGWGAEERLDEGDGAPWSEDGEPPVGPTGSAAARPVWSEEASVEPGLAAPTGSFSDFTLSRYNVTVQDLHDRRRALGWGTVALAAVISVALLYLTLRAHEPFPSMWLAFLPLVWMIPVPFFVAAFRGTHRVLRQHRLDLPEDS